MHNYVITTKLKTTSVIRLNFSNNAFSRIVILQTDSLVDSHNTYNKFQQYSNAFRGI
jgi:hypothetical protein